MIRSIWPLYLIVVDLFVLRFLWQRPEGSIYPVQIIILICYYNRNEAETVVAGQLKQASNYYCFSRIYGFMSKLNMALYSPNP